jgi:predicted amidohydrolase
LARLAEVDAQVRSRFRQRARRFLGTSIAAMIWISEIGNVRQIPEEKIKAEVKLCCARIAPQD